MRRIPFHPSAMLAWSIASLEACTAGSDRIEPIHLFVAILKILDGIYHRDAEILGIDGEDLHQVERIIDPARDLLGLSSEQLTNFRRSLRRTYLSSGKPKSPRLLHRSAPTRALFDKAATLAITRGDPSLSLLHLIYAILLDLPPEAKRFLKKLSPKWASRFERMEGRSLPDQTSEGKLPSRPATRHTPALDALGRDLTLLAADGRLPQVVGRRDEILTLARHLLRISKRNVLLIGDAGVGKTAIVEGLAQHIVASNAPREISSFRIVELAIADLVAGTRYRGDMEERLKMVLEEIRRDSGIILFLDEIHLAVGAGTAEAGSLDIANILKPALARGEVRCIGATTTDEYERHIKGDRAFLRRFHLMRISEPTREEALEICKAWARRIEDVQHVCFDEEAIQAAVQLSADFLHDRMLPDKAIDVLENAATFVKLPTLSYRSSIPRKSPAAVHRQDVVAVLRDHYGINIERYEGIPIREIDRMLHDQIIGQEDAICQILTALEALRNRDKDEGRVLGAILILGPTGTGKTYTAELIGRALSAEDPRSGFVRFNMNEYKERHELSRLIGAPPGFIGHEQQGALFRHVESNPRGVILLDEIEKAHPEILDYFLQIFDTGKAQDSRGRPFDFRWQFFVLTSNVDVRAEWATPIGFRLGSEDGRLEKDSSVKEMLSRQFRPEFLARLDEIVVYRALDLPDLEELFSRQFEILRERIDAEQGIELVLGNEVAKGLCLEALKAKQGARGFLRLFERLIEGPLLSYIRDHQPRYVHIDWRDGKVDIRREK